MDSIAPGQVWQNGKAVITVEDDEYGLNMILFGIRGNQLRFMRAEVCETDEEAQDFIKDLGCELTDKSLSAVEEHLSAI